jgi:transposase
MNKAFVREPDSTADYCPRCGSKGEPVGSETLESFLIRDQRSKIAQTANFCPSARCEVAYFDMFERVVLAAELQRPVYPKSPDAPICVCFGLTREDIEEDVREGVVTRVKALLEKAKTPAARCSHMAPNGRPCVAHVQKYYLQCRERMKN